MSHGALPNNIRAQISPSQFVKKFPSLKKQWTRVLDFMHDSPELGNRDIDFGDPNSILDQLGEDLDQIKSEEIESAITQLLSDFRETVGTALAVCYVGEAEDSYAEVAEEFVWYLPDAYETRLTPRAAVLVADGILLHNVRWTTYG